MDTKAAKIRFKPGDLVTVGKPRIFIVRPDFVEHACHYCLSIPDKDLPRCSKCRFARYCSEYCQKKDWKCSHKNECTLLHNAAAGNSRRPGFEYWLLLIKAVAKLRTAPNEDWDIYNKYTSCTTTASRDVMAKSRFRDWSPGLKVLDPKGIFHSDSEAFFELYSKIVYSASIIIGMRKPGEQPGIGLALYQPDALGSVLACNRNIKSYSQDKQLIVKATRNIYEGDPLIASQGSPFASPTERFFRYAEVFATCACDACTDPAKEAERNVMKCGTQGCNNAVPLDWRASEPCDDCGRINDDRVAEAKECVQRILHRVDSYRAPQLTSRLNSPKEIHKNTALVERAEKVLHSNNFTLSLLYKMASDTLMAIDMDVMSRSQLMNQAVCYMEKMLVPMGLHSDPYLEDLTAALRAICLHYAVKRNQHLTLQYLGKYTKNIQDIHEKDSREFQELKQFTMQVHATFLGM